MKQIPNILSYAFCGISDVLDGYIAHKMNLQSTSGAKLDSMADFIMYTVVIVVLCLWDWHSVVFRFRPERIILSRTLSG